MVSTTSGFAVAATREETRWRCSLLDAELLDDLDGLVKALRGLPSAGAAFALIAVDDEFFVVVRPVPGGVRLLLSDASAAVDYDLAEDVLDELGIPVPDDDEIDDDPWPEGDLALLADLGVSEMEMQLIVSEDDLYPDEQLRLIAQRCRFPDEFDAAIDKV